MTTIMDVDTTRSGQYGRLRWELIEPFGVRLLTENLGAGLEPAEQSVFSDLLYRHGFLEAADQELDRLQLRLLGSYVSPLFPDEEDANKVLAVDPEVGGFGRRHLAFHRDLSYAPRPFHAIALHALEVTGGETSTFVASGTRAYATLPDAMKRRIADLQVATSLSGRGLDGQVEWQYVEQENWPMVTHPLVWPHPITNEPVLMVCELSSVYIEGMERAESEELLQELFAHNRRPDNVYEHVWYDGGLFLWDNLGCTHARKALEGVGVRTLQRLTMGPDSFHTAYPTFSMREFTDKSQGENYMGTTGGRF